MICLCVGILVCMSSHSGYCNKLLIVGPVSGFGCSCLESQLEAVLCEQGESWAAVGFQKKCGTFSESLALSWSFVCFHVFSFNVFVPFLCLYVSFFFNAIEYGENLWDKGKPPATHTPKKGFSLDTSYCLGS